MQVKGIYSSTVGKLLAEKRRIWMAVAFLVPLCLAVAGLVTSFNTQAGHAAIGQSYTYTNYFGASVSSTHHFPGGIDGGVAYCFDRNGGSAWNATYREIAAPTDFTNFTQAQANAIRRVMALCYPNLTLAEMQTYWGANVYNNNYSATIPAYNPATAANQVLWLLLEYPTSARAGTMSDATVISTLTNVFGTSRSQDTPTVILYNGYKSALTTDILASTLTVSSSGAALTSVGGTYIYGPFTVNASGLGYTLRNTRPVTLGAVGNGSDGNTYVNASNAVITSITVGGSFYLRVPSPGSSMTVNVQQTLPAISDARFFTCTTNTSYQRMVRFHANQRYVSGSATFTTTPPSTSTVLTANKTTTGAGAPTSWSFNFALYNSDSGGNQGSLIANGTATNASPQVTFPAINYTAAGTYYYLIRETSTNSGGWTVDSREYLVRVTVENVSGALTVTKREFAYRTLPSTTWGSFSDYANTSVSFVNTYDDGGPILPEVGGTGIGPFASAATLSGLLLFLAGAFTYNKQKRKKKIELMK